MIIAADVRSQVFDALKPILKTIDTKPIIEIWKDPHMKSSPEIDWLVNQYVNKDPSD